MIVCSNSWDYLFIIILEQYGHIQLNCLSIFCPGIEGTLPIDPWFIGGPVIKGFGRGSKVLGIPTGIVEYIV